MGQARLRRQGELFVLAAQDAEQRPDLVRASRPLCSTDANAPAAAAGSAATSRRGRPGLDDHRAERVGHDVVQLARDPCALALDRLRDEPRATGLGAPRLLPQGVRRAPAGAASRQ